MVPSRLALSLLVGAFLLPSCAPPAGLSPAPTAGAAPGGGPPASLAPSAPGSASPPPASASPAPAPATPLPAIRRRLLGSVAVNGQPVEGASLTAWDLATGRAVPLTAWEEAGGGTLRTDAAGAFDLALPPLAAGQVVRLVAKTGSQAFVALLDGQGRLLAAPARGYALREAGDVTLRLVLSPASTAAARAFQGVFKLQLLRPQAAREAGVAQAFEAARRAVAALEEALARQPAWADDLVTGLGPDGLAASSDALRAALGRLGAFAALDGAVRAELARLPLEPLAVASGTVPFTAEDFPLDRPTIGVAGELGFSGLAPGLRLTGEPAGWVPTPERKRRRDGLGSRFRLVDMGRPANPARVTRWYGSFYDSRYILLAHGPELRIYDTGTGVLRDPVATAWQNAVRGAVREPGSAAVLAHGDSEQLLRGTPVDASLSAFTWQPYMPIESASNVYNAFRRFGERLYLANDRAAQGASLYEVTGTPPATVPVAVGHPPVERLPASSRCYDVAFDVTPGYSSPPGWLLAQHPKAGDTRWTAIWAVNPANGGTNTLLVDNIFMGRTLAYSWRRRELYVSSYDTAALVATQPVVVYAYAIGTSVLAVDVDTGATHHVEWDRGTPERPVSGLTVSPDGEVLYGFML
ncbi:MAG: hypothetical protein VKS61_04640 [Candidatus Sericytochromatia bacterium]|nr:hypothetical protein [Candidatus Sericytochromatia bacterium]MEB3221345.1 hypothetical protein [Candidatus Sericytochromatia bacterium]